MMTERERHISVDELYADYGMTDDELHARLNQSLHPRAPTLLYDRMRALDLSSDHEVLDIGCRDARHACELARQFGCRVFAVDPVAHNVDRARRLVAELRLSDAVRVTEGQIESIPCEDRSVDFIWCRDMLNHIADLPVAFRECARVLRPRGAMLVFQTFATDLLEPKEAARLYQSLATIPENMSPAHFEGSLRGTGLHVVECDVIGSEWREHGEESGGKSTSKQLLYIARMRRARGQLVAEIGPVAYETELADCHWGVYQMLGKLCPRLYLLRRDV